MTRLQNGFTFPELIATIAIVGILAAIAIPSFVSLIRNDREVTQANNLIYTLNYARSEAAKADNPVCVCASSDGETCNVTTWNSGWIVYKTDPGSIYGTACGTGPTTSNYLSYVLTTMPAMPSNMTMTTKTPTASWTTVSSGTIQFNPNGQISYSQTLAFNICDPRGASKATDVELLITGRATASQKQGYAVNGTTALTCP